MSDAEGADFTGSLCLKLQPTINLKELDITAESSYRAFVQELSTDICCQLRHQEYICFLSEDIYGSEDKESTEVSWYPSG